MIPIPQTPWTLAIAELITQRMAAAGSGTQPADVLGNLLPGGEPPPEGWLDGFLAGTPLPGAVPPPPNSIPSSNPMPPSDAQPNMPVAPIDCFGGPQKPAAIPSQLPAILEAATAASQSADSACSCSDSSQASQPQAGWEAVKQILAEGGSKPNLGAIVRALYPQSVPPAGGFSPPQPGSMPPRVGSIPPMSPMDAPRNFGTPPGSQAGTIGNATGGGPKVEVNVTFDASKLVMEMKLIAETITHRIVDRQNMIYASQTRGTISRYR